MILASSEVTDAARWAEWARALRAPVAGLGWALPLIDASDLWLGPIRLLCVVATALALVGWHTRWSMPHDHAHHSALTYADIGI